MKAITYSTMCVFDEKRGTPNEHLDLPPDPGFSDILSAWPCAKTAADYILLPGIGPEKYLGGWCPAPMQLHFQRSDGTDIYYTKPCGRKDCPVCGPEWCRRRMEVLIPLLADCPTLYSIRFTGADAVAAWKRCYRQLDAVGANWTKAVTVRGPKPPAGGKRPAIGIWALFDTRMPGAERVRGSQKAALAKQFVASSLPSTHLECSWNWRLTPPPIPETLLPGPTERPARVIKQRVTPEQLKAALESKGIDVEQISGTWGVRLRWRRPAGTKGRLYFYELLRDIEIGRTGDGHLTPGPVTDRAGSAITLPAACGSSP